VGNEVIAVAYSAGRWEMKRNKPDKWWEMSQVLVNTRSKWWDMGTA
jgi:hypothetical protein